MTLQVRLIDLVVAFSRALDHVSRAVSDHHIHVGYFAARLGERLGLDARDRCELLLSALLHDVGAISLKTGLDGLLFEQNADAHARAGWALIGTCPRLAAAGEVVLHHHALRGRMWPTTSTAPSVWGPSCTLPTGLTCN